MALADVTVPDCSFHWDIHNPFTAPRMLLANFYHGSFYLLPWKVIFRPFMKRINCWSFKFSLQCDKRFFPGEGTAASRVQVGIFFNNTCIADKDVSDVQFEKNFSFSYDFDVDAIVNVHQDQELLVIKVKIDIPFDFPEALNDIGFDADIRLLSEDLRRILIDGFDSDMQLLSTDNHVIPVHVCILNARWKNFLALNSLANNCQVCVEISFRALRDILVFLYSGEVRFGWPHYENVEYIAELSHVIRRYDMQNIRRTIEKREMQQRRFTHKDVSTVTYNLPLGDMLEGRIPGFSQECRVNENTQYDFVFTITVENKRGPWLSCKLTSKSEIKVYVQVNFDLRKKIVETHGSVANTYYETALLHFNDYTIHAGRSQKLDDVLFLGCPETFTSWNPVKSLDQRIETWDSIICTLKFSDGRIMEQMHNIVIDTAEQEERARRYRLGSDLFELYLRQIVSDLCMEVPYENTFLKHYAHQSIFKARVTRWWSVFQNAREDDVMPCPALLPLRYDALFFVFQYIYSGLTIPIPHDLLDDIQLFAEKGEFHALINYIMRQRPEPDSSDSE